MADIIICWTCQVCGAKGSRDTDLGKPQTEDEFNDQVAYGLLCLTNGHEHDAAHVWIDYRENPK